MHSPTNELSLQVVKNQLVLPYSTDQNHPKPPKSGHEKTFSSLLSFTGHRMLVVFLFITGSYDVMQETKIASLAMRPSVFQRTAYRIISQCKDSKSTVCVSLITKNMKLRRYCTDQLFPLDGQIQRPCQTVPGRYDGVCEHTCTAVCHVPVDVSSSATCPQSPYRQIPTPASAAHRINSCSITAYTVSAFCKFQ